MATVSEVREYLESKYEVQQVSEDFYQFLTYPDDDRSQMVYFDIGERYLRISSGFADVKTVAPMKVLEANSKIHLGVQLHDGIYFLTHVIPMADLDPSEIDTGLLDVAVFADILEEQLTGRDDY
jgi:hypothetical protein